VTPFSPTRYRIVTGKGKERSLSDFSLLTLNHMEFGALASSCLPSHLHLTSTCHCSFPRFLHLLLHNTHTNQDAPANDMRLNSHSAVCLRRTWSKLAARDRWTRLQHQEFRDGRGVEPIRGQGQSSCLLNDCHGCWSWLSHPGLPRATFRGQFMDW
jgi:hypothetical protein